jgi:hypothetical protein
MGRVGLALTKVNSGWAWKAASTHGTRGALDQLPGRVIRATAGWGQSAANGVMRFGGTDLAGGGEGDEDVRAERTGRGPEGVPASHPETMQSERARRTTRPNMGNTPIGSGCRSHFARAVVMCGRRELVSREPGTGKNERGRERVSGQPGTGRMNGAWYMAGRRNDEGQRYCTTMVVIERR